MAHSLKSVRHLLQDKPTLKSLELEINAQNALLQQVRQFLPGDLMERCRAAQIRDQRLVLHTESPVWATRLRYLAPQLLSLLRHEHPGLTGVTVKVLLERQSCTTRQNAARRSDVAAAIIHESARDTKHPALRAALERLSKSLKE